MRADARRNAERILDATAELLAGDPSVSLEQVAARAGVTRATLYHHFAGRDALLDALTVRSIIEVTAGAMDPDAAERALVRTARGALAGPGPPA